MSRPWREELWRFAGMLGGLGLFGLFVGHVAIPVAGGLLIYLGWHLYNLYRLEYWLRAAKKSLPPDAPGIWGEVFYQFYRLQQRNRKRKRKLSDMLKRFQESASAMPDATVVLDEEYCIEWFNKAAGEFLGLQFPKDIGLPVTNLLRDPDFAEYLEHKRNGEGSNSNAPPTGDANASLKLTSPVGPERILRIHVIPYARKSHLLIARDISRLHRLEQIRRDFVANVSHEMRTPLTVITGFIETMRDCEDPAMAQWERPLTLMQQQAERMQNIVVDLLLLSRLETDADDPRQHRPVAIPALLGDICEEARALGENKQHVTLQVEADTYLRGHPEELRSAFSNLAFNAVRYTPAGGSIRLRWTMDADGAHFEVEDTGEGIEAHHLPRLSERFYRVDTARSRGQGGTGLGLAIVKHVLNRHQGRLRIRSEVGKGSVFTCDFPASSVIDPKCLEQEEGFV